MAPLKNRRHLFFDLDDTLWDFEKNSTSVLKELFNEFDLHKKINANFEDFYIGYSKINISLWKDYQNKKIDKLFLRNSRFYLALKKFGYDAFKESQLMNEQYLLRSPKGKHLKNDCKNVLDYLYQNYSLHIISNGFKDVQHTKIDGCGLRPYFKNIIISEEYQLTKPDEKIFRLAEFFAGTSKENCVMIGDNFDCDMQGALNAGWETVYFSEKEHGFKCTSVKRLLDLKALF